jgi:hypothetical protein
MSLRIRTSDAYSSLASLHADVPMTLLPASMPRQTGCTRSVVSYCSLIVNGQRLTTFALPLFSSRRTLPQRDVGISGCPFLFCTYTSMYAAPFVNVMCFML